MAETERLFKMNRDWWAEIKVLLITGVRNTRTESADTTIKNIKRTGRRFRHGDNYRMCVF